MQSKARNSHKQNLSMQLAKETAQIWALSLLATSASDRSARQRERGEERRKGREEKEGEEEQTGTVKEEGTEKDRGRKGGRGSKDEHTNTHTRTSSG